MEQYLDSMREQIFKGTAVMIYVLDVSSKDSEVASTFSFLERYAELHEDSPGLV